METPRKLVHWALEASLSELGSPYSEASSESMTPTSSLQYINSQLVAHGYAQPPGLCLDGLVKSDMDRVVKSLLGMLSQRVDDMSRTEDLTTKIRTLSYDNERLVSMYRAETERAANAEREMNLHKSRMTALQRTLQSTEQAHKHTTAELQRTRTSLLTLRTAHQTEIKKLEKEKERMIERWNKLSDTQLRSSSIGGGMRAANFEVVESSDMQLRGKGPGFLDSALEEAQQARKDLFDQNGKLRGLLVSTANEIQHMNHIVTTSKTSETVEEPAALSTMILFPSPGTEAASDKVDDLVASLRQFITRLAKAAAQTAPSTTTEQVGSGQNPRETKTTELAEIDRLQAVIDTLRDDLDQAQKQSAQYAEEIQNLFDRYAEKQKAERKNVAELSVDLITAPAQDEELQRFEARFQELTEERQRFTEAAVRLGKEKAAFEAERIKFFEEKRTWQVETMLAELPPTPATSSSLLASHLPPEPESVPPAHSPRRSSRKSVAGIAVGKAGGSKKARLSRRSSGFSAGATLGPPSPKKVIPPFETEVIPSPSKQLPAFTLSQVPLAAPVFVLPPPSSAQPPSQSAQTDATLNSQPAMKYAVPEPMVSGSSAAESSESASAPPVPSTPGFRRPFPMAKPLVPGMAHAYSPVKPSPLSRILMLANSPGSPEDVPRLNALTEEDEPDSLEVSPTPIKSIPLPSALPLKSLAAELGVDEAREGGQKDKSVRSTTKAKSSQTIMKGKAVARAGAKAAVRPMEKEKKRAKTSTLGASKPASSGHDERRATRSGPRAVSTSSQTRVPSSGLAPSRGGARRVPIDSAEAAPVGPAWRG